MASASSLSRQSSAKRSSIGSDERFALDNDANTPGSWTHMKVPCATVPCVIVHIRVVLPCTVAGFVISVAVRRCINPRAVCFSVSLYAVT